MPNEMSHIYDALSDLQRSTGRIEEAVSGIKHGMGVRDLEHAQLETRVNKIEHKQSYAAGRAGVYGAIGGAILGFLSKYIPHA